LIPVSYAIADHMFTVVSWILLTVQQIIVIPLTYMLNKRVQESFLRLILMQVYCKNLYIIEL